ncbi:glycosyltransferase family 4 protein [Mucilaginibacter sp. RS28]|uniref:Glycosyltransferase family 4 protein n=1 Tax=Mucilaginibacter straminoryzae TaxID=2932774 RepID=A0A9X1X717_9SPHI|nr:glycosyltransferase family 4 protein [Mucilaginibacter straminoryzae]MCJ8209809.1 glycosyltransferase family 4 protein [Mucilaginibacter straminoryzae]
MSVTIAFIITVILFIFELFYFRIADFYNIIDKPNHRSSHTQVTIRGGGIIFPIAVLLFYIVYPTSYLWFVAGLLLISSISFVDDVKSVSNKLRFAVHLIAVLLIFVQLSFFSIPAYWIVLALVFFIGAINAINFMDGINGITGIYALVTVLSLYWVNQETSYIEDQLFIVVILSVIVFLFFNLRKKAKCFAGDVGSVSIAFIIVFMLLQLIKTTQNFNYLLFLLVYGLDTATTMFFRYLRGENIFEAHKSHFYQFLANEKKVPHVTVSFIYGFIQLVINLLIILLHLASVSSFILIVASSLAIFLAIRFVFEGKDKLLTKQVTKGV